jgi:WD repeat-containing protein 48
VFYSGDKTGYVCKVDVENCTDISEGECIVICQDAGENSNTATAEGINKIVAIDDSLLWTASGSSSIKRWRVPQRRAVRAQALVLNDTESNVKVSSSPISSSPDQLRSSQTPSPRLHSHSRTNTATASVTVTSQQGRHHHSSPSARNSLTPSFTSSSGGGGDWSASATVSPSAPYHEYQDQEDGNKLYGIPFESLVRLTSPNEQFLSFAPRGRDPDVATLYSAASIVSVPRPSPMAAAGGSRSPPIHGTFHGNGRGHMHHLPSGSPMRGEDMSGIGGAGTGTAASYALSTARLEYEERDIASEAVPLHAEPDEVIQGEHGLVRSILLNDRLHALTVDTAGEVAVWNIVRGLCLGKYAYADVIAARYGGSGNRGDGLRGSGDGRGGDGGESELSPREMALEAVRNRIEGMAVIAPWCTVGTKLGVLAVHITERCFEAEMYADEAGFSSDRHFGDEMRSGSHMKFFNHVCLTIFF